MNDTKHVLEQLIWLFENNRNLENAVPMAKYMKNHFSFLGIKTPLRRELMRQIFSTTGILKADIQLDLIEALWEKDKREYQYAALDYLNKSLKKLDEQHLPFIEKLITTKSWWDTVDSLSPKAVGEIAKKHPNVIPETIDKWVQSENLWLRRAAILFQLKYKTETDENLLYRYILLNADSKEFFIQKAIGWVLREYSKTNPDSVRKFITENELAKLSIREGSKYL
ncbi:MAG TPA: DNA alkylation repair protein [Niallia sp.]|nr:DNA alkylation repair protein [Niallia sp.]